MRWDDLFDDLDGQYQRLAERDEDAEFADRSRLEHGRVSMVERLAGAVGARLRLRLGSATDVSGVLRRIGPDWLLLAGDGSSEYVVPFSGIRSIEGLSARTGAPLGVVAARYDVRMALRAVARDRAPVAILTDAAGQLTGTVDRVGADFLEIAAHAAWELRRSTAVRGVVLVPLAAVLAVVSTPLG